MLNSSALTETRYDGKLVVQMFKELLPVQILSSVVPYLASIANGVVVGNALSAEAIIALGLVSPMTNLFGAIASIIAGGAKILSGRYIGNEIDNKKSYYCGLCIEEMASSVVLNGFVDSAKKKNRIDLLVSCEDENIFVRMRDNTAKYDVVKNLGAFDPEDPCKNIGARMVSKLAKEMTYQCSFNMNVLTIEL